MPNVWTHIIFGEMAAEKAGYLLPSEDVKPFFRLGTQGPDLFFYHNFWPWVKDKPVEMLGSEIHSKSCGPFLMEMIRYGLRHSSDFYLQAYILGFLTHHVLDRNAHPYIIYRSGDKDHKHQTLEVTIDTLLMEELRGLKTWKTPVYKEIDVGHPLYEPIQIMLDELVLKFFPEHAESLPAHYADKSYQDMLKALKILFDPIGWKNKAFKSQISPYSYQKITVEKDYLNRQHNVWYHPSDESEQHEESFDDLLRMAEAEGVRILSAVLDYWKGGLEYGYEGIEKELGNLTYDTGKDCNEKWDIYYFDPII
ncbi:MAG TPA: zinc dependent phospholipase C family protein [Bacillales bacterium]|nr:zinc dependent phospholipase C family protein [Bacillales bacterium]